MFSSQKQLQKRTPFNGTNREDYIEQLAHEFRTTLNIGNVQVLIFVNELNVNVL